MLFRHAGLEIGIHHLVGVGRDGYAAWKPCGAGSDLLQRKGGGMRGGHHASAFQSGEFGFRYYREPFAPMSTHGLRRSLTGGGALVTVASFKGSTVSWGII